MIKSFPRRIKLTQNFPQYWEQLYVSGEDSWSLGKATPALLEFFNHKSCPDKGSVFVPAAGKGWDAEAWANRGHSVFAIDFSPTAVDYLDKISRKTSQFRAMNLDLFSITERAPLEPFDIIYDYGGFSAIHPGRRDEYIEMWLRMLKENGLIIAFLFPLSKSTCMQGPPHSTTEGELTARFNGIIKIEEKIKPKESISERAGKEEIWLLRKA